MFALPVNSTCVVLMFSPVSDLQIHIFSEPICAVLYRQLSNKHPLNELLKYHCRGLIAVNAIGAPQLFFPLGYMDRLSAMGRKGTVLLLSRGLKTFSWKLADLHLDMKVRKAYVLLPRLVQYLTGDDKTLENAKIRLALLANTLFLCNKGICYLGFSRGLTRSAL